MMKTNKIFCAAAMIAAAMISVNAFAQAEGEANAKLGSVPEAVAPKADVPDADTSLVASDKPIKLGESVVTCFRTPKKVMEMPASLVLAGKYDYLKNSSFTVASTLNYEPGIALASDGVWATSVNVRGLGEQRLVTLVDGDRVETATDLTASLSMIDVNDIERVEIVKGAQSVLYGTGAMGGIVNVITKDGHFADNAYFAGNVTSGYASVNDYFSEHAAFMVVQKNPKVRAIIDLSAEWNKVQGVPIAETALLGRDSVMKENPKMVEKLIAMYKSSSRWVNANPDSAARLIVKYGILQDTAAARLAIPRSNLRVEAAESIEQSVNDYLKVFYDMNPEAVGGKMPDKDFFYYSDETTLNR